MENRKEHCQFKVLNLHGKCVASCHRQHINADCIGIENPKKTSEYVDIARGRKMEERDM